MLHWRFPECRFRVTSRFRPTTARRRSRPARTAPFCYVCAHLHWCARGDCTVTDNAPTSGSTQIVNLSGTGTTVASNPVLSITKSHTGNFTQGQVNAIYTVTVSNASAPVPRRNRHCHGHSAVRTDARHHGGHWLDVRRNSHVHADGRRSRAARAIQRSQSRERRRQRNYPASECRLGFRRWIGHRECDDSTVINATRVRPGRTPVAWPTDALKTRRRY